MALSRAVCRNSADITAATGSTPAYQSNCFIGLLAEHAAVESTTRVQAGLRLGFRKQVSVVMIVPIPPLLLDVFLAFTLAFYALLLLRYNLERLQRRVRGPGIAPAGVQQVPLFAGERRREQHGDPAPRGG